MEWMWAAFWAWLGWNILAPAVAIILVMILVGMLALPNAIKQARCKHVRFYETDACDAICSDCGKNLGFIGTIRDQRRST